ncbi:MAG: acetylxylan esterase [Opitutaceae bacterium]|nr:acetylxylan esterase [Opitutaceae bacterium]
MKTRLVPLALAALSVFAGVLPSRAQEGALLPAPAAARIAVTQVRVVPDRPDWTYAPGERVTFRISVVWDQHPLPGAKVKVQVGPELMPAEEKVYAVPAEGLVIDGGTLREPGFIRCVATTEINGVTTRGVATAGFAPEKIVATQVEPDDFDAFWRAGKEALAKVPMEATLTLMPESCTSKVNVYHVSLRTLGVIPTSKPRVYGILCEPRAPGRYPATLHVPGAGVQPYPGQIELAERGFITFQIGVHGIPVNQPPEFYQALGQGALTAYPMMFLDNRDLYYFRRVYLACVRANDFLVSRENWDGRNLLVTGRSQGGQLTIVTAGLDPRVTGLAPVYPAYCDVTGYLHGRAGGWPHMMRDESAGHRTPAKVKTTGYYDVVNFAKRVKAPGLYLWGYNDETCPPTTMYAAYNGIRAPKRLVLALEMGHVRLSPEHENAINDWLVSQVASR